MSVLLYNQREGELGLLRWTAVLWYPVSVLFIALISRSVGVEETVRTSTLSCFLGGTDTVDAHKVDSLLATPVRCLMCPLRPLFPKHLLVCLGHAPIIP